MNLKKTYPFSLFITGFLLAGIFLATCGKSEDIPEFTASNSGPYSLNIEHLELIKEQIESDDFLKSEYDKLINGADQLLGKSFEFVTDKTSPPPSGNMHDYMSISRYLWPDEDGDYTIYKDGITNPEIYDYDRPRLAEMSAAVYTLALAYFFNGEEDYAEKASELIYGWFLDDSTKMRPNMNHAQVAKGVNSGSGQGIIDANDFIKIIEAVSLIYDSSSWSPQSHRMLKSWFYDFSVWIIKKYNADAYENTNVSTWMDAQRAVYFLFSEQEERLNSDFHIPPVSHRINAHFDPDGIQPFEVNRGRSQHYVYFNLRAYLNIAMIRKYRTGDDRDWPLNESDHSILRTALNLLLSYVNNDSISSEMNQNSDFDTCRYIEIFFPAAITFNSYDYADAANILINKGCSDPDITLTYPSLSLIESHLKN